ncbi:hypothetical protein OIE62_07300 [Streptomyces scopuliridis]|uniref:Uncharacterized protein n=1 Tax=Streptomyces scopuliridis TaxID=452529 RepID=A0ACD4ZT33_9ACTN|nr:hypothetical protein [Streptomyces scopuliridis]WSC01620.1 hypothetical protein OG835_34520 [Streptomyces scopuliridis]WSC04841.1 hypothetical protein OIE62_07300 [Streptomyces scopuliridis]
MRVRVATTAVALTAVTLLAVPACSTDTTRAKPDTVSSARVGKPAGVGQNAAPLSSAALEARLLDESDLGSGYLRKPERPSRHDNVTVIGCPALSELGGDAATGGSLTFPRKAKATFTYTGGGNSEVTEVLYSDSAAKLSDGIGRIFDAMTGCTTYQVATGGTAIDMVSQKLTAPRQLGDEQWSQLLTFSTGGQNTVVKQTAIRDGGVLLIVSGSPALVDRHLDKALAKATAGR